MEQPPLPDNNDNTFIVLNKHKNKRRKLSEPYKTIHRDKRRRRKQRLKQLASSSTINTQSNKVEQKSVTLPLSTHIVDTQFKETDQKSNEVYF